MAPPGVLGDLDILLGRGSQGHTIGHIVFHEVIAAHRAAYNKQPRNYRKLVSTRVANIVWNYGGQFREKDGQLVNRDRVLEKIANALREIKFRMPARIKVCLKHYYESSIRQAAVHALERATDLYFLKCRKRALADKAYDHFVQWTHEAKKSAASKWTKPNTGNLDLVKHCILLDANAKMAYPGNMVLSALVDATRELGDALEVDPARRIFEIVEAYGGIFIDKKGCRLKNEIAIEEIQRMLKSSETTTSKAKWKIEIGKQLIHNVERAAKKAKTELFEILYGHAPRSLNKPGSAELCTRPKAPKAAEYFKSTNESQKASSRLKSHGKMEPQQTNRTKPVKQTKPKTASKLLPAMPIVSPTAASQYPLRYPMQLPFGVPFSAGPLDWSRIMAGDNPMPVGKMTGYAPSAQVPKSISISTDTEKKTTNNKENNEKGPNVVGHPPTDLKATPEKAKAGVVHPGSTEAITYEDSQGDLQLLKESTSSKKETSTPMKMGLSKKPSRSKSNKTKTSSNKGQKRCRVSASDGLRPALRARLCSESAVQTLFPTIPGAILSLDDFHEASKRPRVKFPTRFRGD